MKTGRYYRKAYKRNIALKLFETKKGAAARRLAKPDKDGNIELIDTLDDIPQEEDEEDETKAQDPLGKLIAVVICTVFYFFPCQFAWVWRMLL